MRLNVLDSRRWLLWVVFVGVIFTGWGGCSSSDKSKDTSADITDISSDESDDIAVDSVEDLTPDGGVDVPEVLEEVLDTADSTAPPVCLDLDFNYPLSTSQADETFDLGPYLMTEQQHSRTVMWRTLEETDGTVLYGLEAPDTEVSGADNVQIHEVTVSGLESNTRYAYAVRSGGVTSQTHYFTTAVPQGSPFRFVAWGDNHEATAIFGGLLSQMIDLGPRIALGLGDHVGDGSVDSQWKDYIFGPARALFHEVPFYAALGNHAKNSHNYFDLHSHPYPGNDPLHESYYSFTYGNAFVLVLDGNTLLCPLGEVDVPQSEFIKEALESPEAKEATWRIAYAHESPYSESWSAGNCGYKGLPCLRNWVMPLLAEHDFHAFFSGHTHGYERGNVDGIIQIISGGAGGGLDEWCMDWETTSVVYQNHHFLKGDAGCDTLRIEAINEAGELVDWVEMAPDHTIVDEGPMEGLPDLIVSSDSPTLD